MPTFSIDDVRLVGVGAAVPALQYVSWESHGLPPDAFPRWHRDNRRPYSRAARWEDCQSDYCVQAAQVLIEKLGWNPAEIDLVVMVTVTPDYPIPATAIIIQDRLQIPKSAAAFDLPGGPTGLLHGMQLVSSILAGGHLKRALLFTGWISKIVESPSDMESPGNVCGDNGTVLAFEYSQGAPSLFFDFGGNGESYKTMYMPVGGTRNPPVAEMFSGPGSAVRADHPANQICTDEAEVGVIAEAQLPDSVRRMLTLAGQAVEAVDEFYVQPLPLLVEDAIRKNLAISKDRFHGYLYEYGNCRSGGIPVAMLACSQTALRNGRCVSVFASMGMGSSWGSALVVTENLVCPDLIEVSTSAESSDLGIPNA